MPAITKEQIETPALIIDMDILESNIRRMADFFADKHARLRPHFKTHKSPAIAHMQIAAGAKGLCCAKLGEAQVLAESGIRDILIANQIVDTAKINCLAGLAKNTRIGVCVDNADNITDLSEAAQIHNSVIHILIEVEVGMERCGVRTKEEVLSLAKQISESKGLVFEGLQAYAGQLSHKADPEERINGTREAAAKIREIKQYLTEKGLQIKEVSGHGTGTCNIRDDDNIWTEIQAGSYVFMDTDYERLGLCFEKSLTVLATVIHKRHGTAITDAGQKVCCKTMGLPIIKDHPGLGISLAEEHGIIKDEQDELNYLQKIEYYPSHCCTTVNLHDYYYCVRGGLLEAVWPVAGRGKSR